jgi:regulator of protease activity HflC (stomatin/prohibitin superfamily)
MIGFRTIFNLGIIILFVAGFLFWFFPVYNVWQRELAGKAELAQAEYSRRIAVAEAHAKKDSAKLLAEAEIERALGVAKANKIIGDSLKGNEAYLRYLWIDGLKESSKQGEVIYVPTEAGLPILEANRLKK